jgi:hypothetical protein
VSTLLGKKIAGAAGVVVLSVAASAAWQYASGGSKTPQKGEGSAADPSPTAREVVVHEHKVVVEDNRAQNDEPSVQGAREQGASAQQSKQEPVAQQLETMFQADGPATGESRERESTIQRAFRTTDVVGTNLKAIECHASRCRLEVQFKDAATDRQALEKLFMAQDAPIGMAGTVTAREVDGEGKVSAVIHLFPPETGEELSDNGS